MGLRQTYEGWIIKPKTIAELHKYVGLEVEIKFYDGDVRRGILGYNDTPYDKKYGYRKVGYFTIGNLDFKVSHINNLIVIGSGESRI
jgi:hypothetical protein